MVLISLLYVIVADRIVRVLMNSHLYSISMIDYYLHNNIGDEICRKWIIKKWAVKIAKKKEL